MQIYSLALGNTELGLWVECCSQLESFRAYEMAPEVTAPQASLFSMYNSGILKVCFLEAFTN